MKKILCLMVSLAALACAMPVQAQRATTMPLIAGDTIVNTATVTKTLPTLTAGYEGAAITLRYKKINGTNAGTAVLYQSLLGVDYRATGDTLKMTSDTVLNIFKTAPVPVFYRVVATGSGTMSGVLKIDYVYRKHD